MKRIQRWIQPLSSHQPLQILPLHTPHFPTLSFSLSHLHLHLLLSTARRSLARVLRCQMLVPYVAQIWIRVSDTGTVGHEDTPFFEKLRIWIRREDPYIYAK
ncbi:hypothetical protein AKJ16_DCAP04842 [Drosera capensis]